ncbi:MAG: translocation/assembly module TamB domain-containing protein, partial [Chromatocurvus sp.]
LDARVEVRRIQLQDIGDTLPAATLAGSLVAGGSVTDLAYQLDLNADSAEFGALALVASGGFSDQVVALEQLQLSRQPGDARLDIAGRASLAGPTPTFDLKGDWRNLAWPLQGEPRINSGKGGFTADGSVEDYSLALTTALDVPGQTGGQLTLSGRGDSEAFELADLQLTLLEGSLQGRGNVRWSPDVRGAITLDGEGLNPAVLAPDFPASLQIALRAEGGISNGVAEADIETLSLSGTFRERPVDVRVEGRFRDAQLSLDTLRVASGDTRVSASGVLGDSLDLQWDIDSPDLGDLLPGASGSLAGKGGLAGSVSLPAVRGSLRGEAIAYADYRLERLALDLDVDLQRQAPSRLELTFNEVLLGGIGINRLSVSGAGNRSDHQLSLQLESPEGAAQLRLGGDLRDTLWQGELTDGEFQYGELAAWNLAAAQPLRLSRDEQYLERGCWSSGDSRLCLQGRRADGDLDATLSLNAFALAYLRPMLPDVISLAGTLEAQASIRQQADAVPELELAMTADGVEVRTGESTEQPDELLLGLKPSELTMNYGAGGLLADVSMPFTNGGVIDVAAQVGPGSDPVTERPLTGKVALALNDIGFLTLLSPEIEQAAGALDGDLNLSGTLLRPVPEGELSLAGGLLELAAPGLMISDIGVRVSSSDGAELDFEGQATSGKGTLRLGGSAQLDGAQTVADIDIQGDSFEVVNTVDARVFVSPDLQVALRETGIRITGQVTVPRAEITPQELPESVVTASSDQVIMTDDGEGGAAAVAQRELEARIRIVLGDAVSVDGFGFKGRLTGGLTVNQQPGQPTLGSGEVNILDGEYRAYGQGLVIDRGKILFAGGPISQPGLNVRAVRRPAEGIVVGVSVRGPMQDPDFSVFSEPGMTQSEQLSWLVLGRPLNGASEGESSMIAQAAMALGLKGGNFLADRFGGGLGVDSVGIETGSGEAGAASDVNQAAFVIGKYLSPDLFVSYGIGLFDSISTVKLEYTLTDHWKVSTESSTLASGGDVTYTIER